MKEKKNDVICAIIQFVNFIYSSTRIIFNSMEKKILENLLAGYWEWNLGKNTVFLSKNLKSSLGYKEDELDDKPSTIRSLIYEEDLKRFDEAMQHHLNDENKKPFSVDIRYRHKNGSTIWINCTGSVSESDTDSSPARLLGCHVDITRAKEAEKLLAQEKQLLSVFFDENLDLLCVADMEGNFIRISSQWEKTLGFTKDEIMKHKFQDFIHPEDLATTYETMATLQSQKEVRHFVNRYRCKDGTYRHLEWRSIPKGNLVYASARDITIRVKALNDLTQLQKLNSTIIRVTSEGIVLQDNYGMIIQCNEAAEQILGLSYDQMIGKTSVDKTWRAIHEDGSDFPGETHPAMMVIKTGRPMFNQIMGVYKLSGNLTWILINSVPILDTDNVTVLSTVTSFTDITELKNKENRLQKTLETVLDQKNKLENFAHIVSHNLRSHSGNISALIKMLNMSANETERTAILSHITKASDNLNQTITDLNEIVDSRKNKEVTKIKLKDFFNHVLDSISAEIKEKSVDITLDISKDLILDYKQAYLESIFLNFITNAIKYRHPERFPIIRISAYQKEGITMLEIEDNGIGIDLKKDGKNLFGMYKTFHGNPDAKGIGLYITKNQIEEMGGTIAVESEVNKGTKFIIRLNSALD